MYRHTNTLLKNTNVYTRKIYQSLKPITHERQIKLPREFDGRKVWKNLLTPVMNQGKCGSCWTFASTGCLGDRFNIQSRGRMKVHLSPTKLLLCDTPENKNKDKIGSCFGNTLHNAFRYLYIHGTPEEKCIPYTERIYREVEMETEQGIADLCSKITGEYHDMCEDKQKPQRHYKCLHYYVIPKDEHEIMKDIYTWGPVATGFNVYPDLHHFDGKSIYEWDGIGKSTGGHSCVIVGWGEEDGKKYWIIRNSWGKEWGDNGYFKMMRGSNHLEIEDNCIGCIPDFFYQLEHGIHIKFPFLESQDMVIARNTIQSKLDVIDINTGYTRRVLHEYPELIKSIPIQQSELPNWNTFIAGNIQHGNNHIFFIITISIFIILLLTHMGVKVIML